MLKLFKWQDPQLKNIWDDFYQDNLYLSPYSSWEYNNISHNCFKFQTSRWKEKNFFLVEYENDKALAIVPLTLRRGILNIFGDFESGGALDFIYPANTSLNVFETIFRDLRAFFPKHTLCLNKINERSLLYKYLREKGYEPSSTRNCVKIEFRNSYEEYFKSLSQNQRRNMHASHNRLAVDKKEYNLDIKISSIVSETFMKDSLRIYNKREGERVGHERGSFSKFRQLHFEPITPAIKKMTGNFNAGLYLKGAGLMSFLSGFITNGNEIICPRGAIDSTFARYYPGKLLINETIKWLIANTNIRCLDLSRGEEIYKYEMGGIQHINYAYEIKL
jgi:Protein involved in cellulose biosynthesis (CelD)